MGTSVTPAHARPTVTTGIIFETDGTPQTQNYTCQQAQTAASAAKAAGIEVFTIGFFATNNAGSACPDTSGPWHGKTVVQSLAAMATNSRPPTGATPSRILALTRMPTAIISTARRIRPNSRTCSSSAALALAGGSRLVQLYPQPVVTGVGPSSGNVAGGTSVTISGNYFSEAYSVTFGGTPATSFHVVSDTSISAVAPAHGAGTVDIQVLHAGRLVKSPGPTSTRTCHRPAPPLEPSSADGRDAPRAPGVRVGREPPRRRQVPEQGTPGPSRWW